MVKEVKLPELGENIVEAQVLSVLVSPGDTIGKDQSILELETDKATAEVPSDVMGIVKEVLVKNGDSVRVGQTLIVVESNGDGAKEPAAKPAEAPRKARKEPVPEAEEEPVSSRAEAAPPRTATPPRAAAPPARPAAPPEPAPRRDNVVALPSPRKTEPESAPAAPSIRRLARELGIDVSLVPGTGPGGRISEDDVKAYARDLISRTAPGERQSSEPFGESSPELPDFTQWGEVEREPLTKIRRVIAETMATSWSTIPHVTQFDRADITDLEAWRKRHAAKAPEPAVTLTAISVKVVAAALRKFPRFNASLDERAGELVLKKFVNVGVAVDTENGLLVPVVKNADQKNILEIATDLGALADRARTRKASMEDLSGATFNVSNLGGLGTTNFTPIVAWPQAAVLGIGRASQEPRYSEGSWVPRLILPLVVSYDHRIVDGADAARFLRWIAEALEEPLLLALEG